MLKEKRKLERGDLFTISCLSPFFHCIPAEVSAFILKLYRKSALDIANQYIFVLFNGIFKTDFPLNCSLPTEELLLRLLLSCSLPLGHSYDIYFPTLWPLLLLLIILSSASTLSPQVFESFKWGVGNRIITISRTALWTDSDPSAVPYLNFNPCLAGSRRDIVPHWIQGYVACPPLYSNGLTEELATRSGTCPRQLGTYT